MRLRKKLRQQRAEERIRARDLKKRGKAQARILGDTDIDEVTALSGKIGAAEQQLSDAGYDVGGEPVETMAMYNDVYGDGNGEAQEPFAMYNESGDFEHYENALNYFDEIVSNFESNFDENYEGENFESLDEHFGKKIKKWFGDIKNKLGGAAKLRSEKREQRAGDRYTSAKTSREGQEIRSIARDLESGKISLADAAKELNSVAGVVEQKAVQSPQNEVLKMFIAALLGVFIGKMLK